jgi:hypothetical protein
MKLRNERADMWHIMYKFNIINCRYVVFLNGDYVDVQLFFVLKMPLLFG